MAWQDISTAPQDGTPIQAEIPGYGSDNIISWHRGFIGENSNDCGTWVCVEEQEPPICWTDGVCWSQNEDGVPSVRPTRWKPLHKLVCLENGTFTYCGYRSADTWL